MYSTMALSGLTKQGMYTVYRMPEQILTKRDTKKIMKYVNQAARHSKQLVFDFSQTIESSSSDLISLILEANKAMRQGNGKLSLYNMSDTIESSLEVSSVTQIVPKLPVEEFLAKSL